MKHSLFTIFAIMFFTGFVFPEISSAETGLVKGLLRERIKKKVHDDLFSVSFANDKDGWACGRFGTILHTADGGKTWSPQQSGTDFTLSSIYFVDSQYGWAVGNKGTILHTPDGGKTWQKQQSPVDYYHMDVYFVAPQKGWVASERTHILGTNDGGKTWRVQFKDQDYILKALSFCDAVNGWAVGEFGYIYHTADGGETWQWQGGSCYFDEETGVLCGGTFLYDVAVLDPQTAMAVGIDGYTVMTADGGKSWNRVDTNAPRTQLYCITSDEGGTIVVGGIGACVVSEDRGRTWEKALFTPHIDYSWIYGLAHRGDSHFVACGDEGAIYRSSSPKVWERID